MGKSVNYFFYFLVLFLSINSLESYASKCGLHGSVDMRLNDCNQSFDSNFRLLSDLNNLTFWYDNNTKLTWHYPFASSIARGDYSQIKDFCKKPYNLPYASQLKVLAKYNSLPFELNSKKVIIRKRKGGSVNSYSSFHNYYVFDFYYDFEKKKRKRNRARKSDQNKYQIVCVADLENYFLFEGER